MINDFDLTPDEIKQQYPEDVIKKAETFEPHGVSEQTAIEYLKTPEGEIYLKRVIEAAPTNADIDDLTDRAIGHICSAQNSRAWKSSMSHWLKSSRAVKPHRHTHHFGQKKRTLMQR